MRVCALVQLAGTAQSASGAQPIAALCTQRVSEMATRALVTISQLWKAIIPSSRAAAYC